MPSGLQSLLELLVVAMGATLALRAFYAAFHARWPENYFGGEEGVDPVVSRSIWRYATFRLVPAAVVFAAAGTVATRLGESRPLSIGLTASVYIILGPAHALLRDWRARPRRVGLVVYRAASVIGCLAIAVVVAFAGGAFDRFVPDEDEFVGAVWIAVAVVALAQFARSLAAPEFSHNRQRLLARARAEVDPALLDMLRREDGRDPAGFEAVALAEQLNRPAWVRRLERTLMRADGSYGLMQMTSERPISDADSVLAFLEWADRLPDTLWPAESFEAPRDFFLTHNPDTQFANLATNLYWAIRDEAIAFGETLEVQDEVDNRSASPNLPAPSAGLEAPVALISAVGGALVGAGIAFLVRRGCGSAGSLGAAHRGTR